MSTATDHIARGIARRLSRRARFTPEALLTPAETQLCRAVADQVMAELPDLFDRLPTTKAAADATPVGASR